MQLTPSPICLSPSRPPPGCHERIRKKMWKSRLVDLSLICIPLIAIGLPAWIHGSGFENVIDETVIIDAQKTATAISAPASGPLWIEKLCADDCVRCSTAKLKETSFARPSRECIRLQPAVQLPSGDKLSCRNECDSTHAVLLRGSRSDPS